MEILNFFKDVLSKMGQIFGGIGDVISFVVSIGAQLLIPTVIALVIVSFHLMIYKGLDILVAKFSNKYPKVTKGKVLASVVAILAVLFVIPFYLNGNGVSVTELLFIDLKNVLVMSTIEPGIVEFFKTLLAIFGVISVFLIVLIVPLLPIKFLETK